MGLIATVVDELKLRDEGQQGKLDNLSTVEVICLAYRLGLFERKCSQLLA